MILDCTDEETCTTVGVGPCEGTETATPTAYLKSHFVGLAFVDEDQYLQCADLSSCDDLKVVSGTGPGFRDHFSGSEYAYTMTGNIYGSLATAGGYAGLASYLNTGSADINTQTNNVWIANSDSATPVDRSSDTSSDSNSDMGAPDGPYKVCISERQLDGSCGPNRTFTPSQYKFSIFGSTTGSAWPPIAGQDGFPAGMDNLGVRMKLSAVGFNVDDIKVNGRAYDTGSVNDDITSLSLMHSSGGINIDFPTRYNTGPTTGAQTDGTMLEVTETKTVKIKVHGANSAEQFVYIDFLFELAGQDMDTYFMYDPDVSEVHSSGLVPEVLGGQSSAPTTTTMAGVVIVAIVGAATWSLA